MPIRRNGYFNNPALGQISANLADMFAPPSGADAAGWATAHAKNAEAEREADRYRMLVDRNTTPEIADFYLRTMPGGAKNTYYDIDQGNATLRANNAADNARALEDRRMQEAGALQRVYAAPIGVNKDQTVYLPEQTAAATGLNGTLTGMYGVNSGETLALPNGQMLQGAPKPMTSDEWRATQNERLRQSGQISDDMLIDTIVGDKTPVKAVVGGKGVYVSPGAAVRGGLEVYEEPKPEKYDNYLAFGPDGQEKRFLGYVGPEGQIIDASTREPVANVVRKEGTSGGFAVELGKDGGFKLVTGNNAGLTSSRVTDLQRSETENSRAVNELTTLFNTLRPDDLGVAGNINEWLTNYGAQAIPGLARPDVASTRANLNATTLGLAKALVQDDRLSDADRRAANEVMVSGGLGESLPGAQAKLASLIALSAYRQKFANTVRTGGEALKPLDGATLGQLVDDGLISPRIAETYKSNVLDHRRQATNSLLPGVNVPEMGTSSRSQDTGAVPTVSTPEEASRLPPGTRFRTPDGRIKVRP
ncbi:hypothetical protein [Brucella intermedia]|uniref:hypothetical protein n=1 Tax=Brucella intermedia TaxID=94625 RepID=UPI0015925D45|nr:hypothetical protein [Brucella intermedia]